MKYDLNKTSDLTDFLKKLFEQEELTHKAADIMKFFIVTRNFGLNDYPKYIRIICDHNDFEGAVVEAFKDGFKNSNIEFNDDNLFSEIIKNYHENGFFFHSFPGIYANSINENGILINNRDESATQFYDIVHKYQFGSYFDNSKNKICVTPALTNNNVRGYSLLTPEWLYYFLKNFGYTGYQNLDPIYERGNLEEIMQIANNALQNAKKYMKTKPFYNESDFVFLEKYINEYVYNRFKNGNNCIGISFISRKDTAQTFFDTPEFKIDKELFWDFANKNSFSKERIVEFLTNDIVNVELTTEKNIPRDLFEILTYNEERKELNDAKKR